MKISEWDKELGELTIESLKDALNDLRLDPRSGAQKLLRKYEKKILLHEKLIEEWQMKCSFDEAFHENTKILVGIDEVGRGPLAGPVVAAAVILPYHTSLVGLKDSKKMSRAKRETLFDQIKETALAIGVGIIEAEIIDEINILQATFKAMRRAVKNLGTTYDLICVDGDKTIPRIEETQHAIIAGDDKSASIAAASVIAKVTRDRMMEEYAMIYKEYDWQNNKGYGSLKHYEAIRQYGITSLHRKSFLKKEGIF